MQKFTFNKKEDLYIPNDGIFKPLKDKNGNTLTGEQAIQRMAMIADKYTKETGKPVPIPDVKFVAWLKGAKAALDRGESAEKYFERTLVKPLIKLN